MGVRPVIRRARTVYYRLSAKKTGETENNFVEQSTVQVSKDQGNPDTEDDPPLNYSSAASRGEMPDWSAQSGVQDVEAVTITWSKRALIAVFIKYVPSYFVLRRASDVVTNVPTGTDIITLIVSGSCTL
jgi:hypothetical protein